MARKVGARDSYEREAVWVSRLRQALELDQKRNPEALALARWFCQKLMWILLADPSETAAIQRQIVTEMNNYGRTETAKANGHAEDEKTT